jgi:PAS domain S-box-containing protein
MITTTSSLSRIFSFHRKTLAFVSLLAISIADFIVPPGTAMGILYLLSLMLVFDQDRKTIIWYSTISSILIIADIVVHFETDLHYSVYGDRTLSLMAVWITCFILLAYRKLNKTKIYHQKKLLEQEIKYHKLVDNLIEGAQIIGHNWQYLYVNDAVVNQSGFTRHELLNSTMTTLYPGIEQTSLFKTLAHCMQTNTSSIVENEFQYPDGNKGWFHLTIQPVPEGLFILSNDITSIKQKKENEIKQRIAFEYTTQLEEYKKENMQSLRYAQRLQEFMMHAPGDLKEIFPESFILSQPKNHVSGDFFWFNHTNEHSVIAACDCTGHGVPGAMLTILGMTILHNTLVDEKLYSPASVLKQLDINLHRKLSRRKSVRVMADGMDASIMEIDRKKMVLKVAGSNNPVYLVRNGELMKIEVDKYHLGEGATNRRFLQQHIPLNPGDMIYAFSDGYADQFGGSKNRKFGSKRFRELLVAISHQKALLQQESLKQALDQWQDNGEQTDDILVMGIRV